MLAFKGRATYCLAAAVLLSVVSAGSFLIGYQGGYRQALCDERERFPNLVPSQPATEEWNTFLDQRWKLPPWLQRGWASSRRPTAPTH